MKKIQNFLIDSNTHGSTGAMVLAHSLRDSGTKKQLVALVTLDSISANAVEALKVWFLYNLAASLTDIFRPSLTK